MSMIEEQTVIALRGPKLDSRNTLGKLVLANIRMPSICERPRSYQDEKNQPDQTRLFLYFSRLVCRAILLRHWISRITKDEDELWISKLLIPATPTAINYIVFSSKFALGILHNTRGRGARMACSVHESVPFYSNLTFMSFLLYRNRYDGTEFATLIQEVLRFSERQNLLTSFQPNETTNVMSSPNDNGDHGKQDTISKDI
ncbi:predicted protein [Histoplasma capsulatum G186AR]|uniref:Uncharacterized protein n=1 Tax=Ajellomyces capsulatus (strain G186AR / H82 / ATCC MYA-2454 / RMSCC 2432) TaxID=447093 RepID=C0NBQ7_AJECG|nr:uncharacterized protein HCBG_00553 [Histoplasma capsulatum G186AR]EEH11098.1 predicted protein [Histoplasma capsulatum G186AR]